jgi:methyl-accepting chemotaxis protein
MEQLNGGSPAECVAIDDQVMATRAQALSSLLSYQSLIVDPEDRGDYEKMQARSAEYFQLQDRVRALSRDRANAGKGDTAAASLIGEWRQALATLLDTEAAWIRHTERRDAEAAATSRAVYSHAVRTLWAITIVLLLNNIYSAVRNTRGLLLPIREALALARSVAGGDLSRRSQLQGGDEICQLLQALNDMSALLSALIAEVTRSSLAVELTAREIAQSNEELSQRTQQQAASLEETAASMDQITSLGKNNSSNANQADRLARQARDLAESGGSIVTQAVCAVGAINEGSAKISNIISIIDDIAFQTNLLALNAAVEAARAGGQGRGFAVVAAEVRALALRSADAAKQVKALITDSAVKVHTGSGLVDRTGEALTQILGSVREITGLIIEIANSSREQAERVQRVNESVLHLDSATHKNAALVEESSAASRALQDQAEALSRRAAFFTLRQPAEAVPRSQSWASGSQESSDRASTTSPVVTLSKAS